MVEQNRNEWERIETAKIVWAMRCLLLSDGCVMLASVHGNVSLVLTGAIGATTLLLSHPWAAPAAQASMTVSGTAETVDGDTLEIGSARVRLFGIDAPETAQECMDAGGAKWACGRAAARALEKLTAGQQVTCRGDTKDDYGRLLAVCTTRKGEVNARLVRQGLAWAFVNYSNAYVAEEAEAKAARRGVFSAPNEPPWEFRAHRWEKAIKSAEVSQRQCPIKGNVSRSGERIYHMPWQSSYEKTVINEAKGERWFCDESEAERAGWRRAR